MTIDWEIIPTIVVGVVFGVIACIVLAAVLTMIGAGLYLAWYFFLLEPFDTWRFNRAKRTSSDALPGGAS